MTILNLQVGASTDDVVRWKDGDLWNLTNSNGSVGYGSSTYKGRGGGMRFLNVTIPKGAIIIAAYLTLTAQIDMSHTVVNGRIQIENADNGATFSTQENFDARSWSAAVDWDNIPAWTADVEYNSPSLVDLIQAVVNRAGWSSENAMVFVLQDYDQRSDTFYAPTVRDYWHWDGSSAKAPKLHIEYTVPAGRSYGFIIG